MESRKSCLIHIDLPVPRGPGNKADKVTFFSNLLNIFGNFTENTDTSTIYSNKKKIKRENLNY